MTRTCTPPPPGGIPMALQLSLKAPDPSRCLQAFANHLHLAFFESTPEVRVLSSAGVTRLQRSYDPVRLPPVPPPEATLRPLPSHQTGLPRLPEPPFRRAVPTTPADRAGALVDCFPAHAAFPKWQEVGIRIVTFEACSGFTHVTARRIAQPPTGDLCHEAPTHAVTRTSRSSATGSIDNSPGGFLLHVGFAPSWRL